MKFTVYGDPVAQGRPRFSTANGFARAYDPAKSRDYKDYVRLAAAKAMNGQAPLEGALELSIRVYRPVPKSFSGKKAKLAEAGYIRPTTKPDLDNYTKGIKDALKSICWKDDSQIVSYKEPFGKFYSETPRIEIEVHTLDDSGTENQVKNITHWKPLPESPKEG
jgi:Holliday junction resolvase RusA-like endonuclease